MKNQYQATREVAIRSRIDDIEHWLEEELSAREILTRLKDTFGFAWRPDRSPERLSYKGVSTTCAAGAHGLLRNWIAAAKRKIKQPQKTTN